MALHTRPAQSPPNESRTDGDFTLRLEQALSAADRERRRHLWLRRGRVALALLLLVGPVVGWHLTLSSPGGAHVVVDALAWLAFLLDVGVHIDTAILSYLRLQALPTVVGVVLFVLLAVTLLGSSERGKE